MKPTSTRDILTYGAGYLRGLAGAERKLDQEDGKTLKDISEVLLLLVGSEDKCNCDNGPYPTHKANCPALNQKVV